MSATHINTQHTSRERVFFVGFWGLSNTTQKIIHDLSTRLFVKKRVVNLRLIGVEAEQDPDQVGRLKIFLHSLF
jgi:hypothetical protein